MIKKSFVSSETSHRQSYEPGGEFFFFPGGIRALFVKLRSFEVRDMPQKPYILKPFQKSRRLANVKEYLRSHTKINLTSRIMIGFLQKKNWTPLLTEYFTPVKFQNKQSKT